MKRAALVGLCLLVGLAVGLGGALALGDDADPTSVDSAAPSTTVASTTARPPPTTGPPSTPAPGPPPPSVLLAWTAGGLPSGFADALGVLPAVVDEAVVRGDLRGLIETDDGRGNTVDRVEPGWEIPFDVLALDPAQFGSFVTAPVRRVLRRLGPDEVVLSETSAGLRRLDVGGRIQLESGPSLRVIGIVPDVSVAGAEAVVTPSTGAAIGVTTERYVLLHHRGGRARVDDAIRMLAGEPVRTRAGGETPFLRHADGVLPQALIKAQFGEFSYRDTGPGPVTLDPAWVAANIVQTDLPVLGPTTCHRTLLPALQGALRDLVAANLAHLVASFEGCFNARTIAGSTQLSRHAWGAAVDLNFSSNPTGVGSMQDARLVDIFERWGFGSGDFWLVPDSGHFEYIAPPSPG